MDYCKKNLVTCPPKILIWGGKSQARIILEMIKESYIGEVKFIFDNNLKSLDFSTDIEFINDAIILKNRLHEVTHFIVCIGAEHGYARYSISSFLENSGLEALSIKHFKSYIEPSSMLGKGYQIMPCAVVHKFCEIGEYTIINTNASVDHECKIGNGVHIMGGATIAGKVTIGDYATIGSNATILPFQKVGQGAFVGAGAVVTKNVEPFTIVAGIPAKVIKPHELKFFDEVLKQLL